MSKTRFTLGYLDVMLWVAPVFFFVGIVTIDGLRGADAQAWIFPVAWVMVFVLARLWIRVRPDVSLGHASFTVDVEGIVRSYDFGEILVVVPTDHIAGHRLALFVMRPIWRSSLLTTIPEAAIRQLVESDVRVIGWSRSRLAEQDRGDAFFSSED